MNILFNKVFFKYDEPLLNNISFSIKDSSKIGLIGTNGSGKTTLLKLLLEEEFPTSGEILKSANIKISYLSQTTSLENYNNVQEIINTLKEDNIYEFKSLLGKFQILDYLKPIRLFSRGEQKRIEIAFAFTKEFDLLILDEITNHLDFDLIVWIENYLKKMKKALFIITHDRYFLQNVCNEIYELDHKTLYTYEGNYEKYLELKEYNNHIYEKELDKLKKLYKKELEWIRQGVEARRTKKKDRIERFNQLKDKIAKEDNRDMKLEFSASRLGNTILEFHNVGKCFENKNLFNNLTYNVLKGDRIGIVGKNGKGKSTLFKIILGLEKPSSGELIVGETVKIGYFSQEFEIENNKQKVIDYIKKVSEVVQYKNTKITAESFLENFLFSYSKQNQLIESLSGGEKRRLQLVRSLLNDPNVLLLDEPTNDLDIETLEILENYLDDYNGVVLAISHDRYFLDKIADKIFYLDDIDKKFEIYYKTISEIIFEKKEVQKKQKTIREKGTTLKMTYLEKKEFETILDEINIIEKKLQEIEHEININSSSYSKILELTSLKEVEELNLNKKMERYFYLEDLNEKIKKGE